MNKFGITERRAVCTSWASTQKKRRETKAGFGKRSLIFLLAYLLISSSVRRFPKARVWPPLPSPAESAPTSPSAAIGPCSGTQSNRMPTNASPGQFPVTSAALDGDLAAFFPDPAMQEHLLELYFTYVHATFPIIHKDAFWEGYRRYDHCRIHPNTF